MPRVLSVSRTTVRQAAEPEYLATLGELATRHRARGRSLWLFRHPSDSETFLEFSESATAESHRGSRSDDATEAALEARLRTLADYAPDAWVLWTEIPLQPR